MKPVKPRYIIAASLSALMTYGSTTPASANSADAFRINNQSSSVSVLSASDYQLYSSFFSALKGERWDDVQQLIKQMPKGEMRDYATAEYYLAGNSPFVEGSQLEELLFSAPWLPHADKLSSLATKRGITRLPSMPEQQQFAWLGSAPTRGNPDKIDDPVGNRLRSQIIDFIKNDDPASAERLLQSSAGGVAAPCLTELQQRVAWSYYIENDDVSAQRVSNIARNGSGEWAAQAEWVYGLSSWRLKDYTAAQPAFYAAASKSSEPEMQSAGYYWSARAAMASGKPQDVQPLLQTAAQNHETFYGLLAGEALFIEPLARKESRTRSMESKDLVADKQISVVFALTQLGQTEEADEALKYFARTGSAADHDKYMSAARQLGLPQTQLWLAHYGPAGTKPEAFARYPAPNWSPSGGWRVDRSLVYGHALQESRFRTSVVSPAGARGLMQVMPGTARGMAATRGESFSEYQLNDPSYNLEYGQSYLELLRDRPETGGYLPKVIAAYNAGPAPIGRWQYEVQDNGDPLLFIESIPYWETREYVGTVMRNYWMYEAQDNPESNSRRGLAQNMWPRFPGMTGPAYVRLMKQNQGTSFANR